MLSAMIASACDARVPAASTCVARFIAARTSGGRFVAVWVISLCDLDGVPTARDQNDQNEIG